MIVDLFAGPDHETVPRRTGQKLPSGWTHKACPGCGERKERDEYGKNGQQARCRTCRARDDATPERRAARAVYRRRLYHENPEEAIRKALEWKRQNPERWKDASRKHRHGVPYGTYARMLAEQDGGCAICGAPEPDGGSLHMDHDHENGRVRSLLCDLCNRGLGYFADDPEQLERAAAYLRWHARIPPRG